MASSSTRLCRAVCLCVFSFASGFLVARLASLRPLKKSAVQKKENPSSTITLTKKYQVFLSFRGEDTRVGFTSHLYDALSRTCILTFIDYKLVRGDEISTALFKSIQESMIAVIIFSKDYASSKWCLRELAEIMKFKKLNELIVLPIFYNVDPSDVRKQTGPFKDSFAKHENDSPEEVLEWREAFTKASNLSGWDSAKTRSESELVRYIVEDVKRKLMGVIEKISPPLNDFEGRLIGIENRIEPVMSLLSRRGTVDVIGFWGMGGIGKTTLAEFVFHRISGQFDGSCFIEVGERLENRESNCLQLEVLSKVLHEVNMELATPTILHPFIKQRLTQKKVLIVFDGVNKFRKPLETLVYDLLRCGLGSRIIITSRDKHVLYNYNVPNCNIYEVKGLNFDEALELFCKYAFKQKHPTEGFMHLSVRMVHYANGNPLGLRVLGSHLLGKDKQEWESAFDDLQGIGDSEIFKILKISYDGLSDKEKDIFLDIACFFNDFFEQTIAELLDCKGPLRSLINKSLITITALGMEMHDLLKEMGREIVIKESPKNPGKRSRLWKPNDVIQTLNKNKGTKKVEGISLWYSYIPKDEHLILSRQVFDKMPNLRLLLFTASVNDYESNKVHLLDGLNSLPDELTILKWHKYPLKALPKKFSPEKLVELDLSKSNIEQLWKETEDAPKFPKLKRLDLRGCRHLIGIPNLTDFPSLECVDLSSCLSLVEFPSSVQLNKLWYLCLEGCSNVTKFPPTSASIRRLYLSGTAIEEVPSSIQSLTNLIELHLSGCRRLKHIPASIFKLKSLLFLDLDGCSKLETFLDPELSGTAITELSSSIEHLDGLLTLKLSNCENLEMLPSSICDLESLYELDLSNCSKLDKLPENLGNLKSLGILSVEGTAIGQLPSSIRYLENLEELNCSDCKLTEIPEDIGCLKSLCILRVRGTAVGQLPSSIRYLCILDCSECRGLTKLPPSSEFKRCITSKYHEYVNFLFTNCINLDQKAVSKVFEESLKGLEEQPTQFSIFLPGTEIPEWFTYHSSGSLVNIPVLRQDWINRKLMGFAICAVLGFEEYQNIDLECDDVEVVCRFETYYDWKFFSLSYESDNVKISINSDHILLGYFSFSNKFDSLSQNLEKIFAGGSDCVDISFEIDACYKVKHCAVHPIYAEPNEIIGASIEDIGETSGLRSGRSDDNEEEVEPHPKRFCTQPKLMLPISNQNP